MIKLRISMLLSAGLLSACSNAYDPTLAVPATLSLIAGDMQTGTVATQLPSPILVQVKDASGQPVSAVPVHFVTSTATLGHTTVLTDAAGNAATVVNLSTIAGPATITASVDGVAAPIVFSVIATPGPATTITLVRGSGQTGTVGALLDSALVVRVNDAQGNAVTGALIDWLTAAGTFTTPLQTTSGADGTTFARLRLPAVPDTFSVKATLHATPSSVLFTIFAIPM